MTSTCKMCGKPLPTGATQCLNCGYAPGVAALPIFPIQPESPGRRVWRVLGPAGRVLAAVTVFFTVLFAVALHAGLKQSSNTAPPPPVSTPAAPAPDPTPDSLFSDGSKVLLVMGSHLATDSSGSRTVIGRIKNISPNALSFVRVDITLYGKHGKQVGTTAARVKNLDAGKVWRFRAGVPQDAATDYEINSVICY